MSASEKEEKVNFTVTEKFKTRAFELLDESHGMQFAEGLRLNNAAAVVFSREEKRLMQKYGKDDPRVKEMSLRAAASALAKADLFARYKDAMTPPATVKEGWTVDGFVRGPDGRGIGGLTVAAYDREGNKHKELGQATTDDQGHFAIKIEKFPPEPPKQVFMRASKGLRVLPSNDIVLTPKAGVSERIEIIIGEREKDPKDGGDKPPDKPTDKPTDKSVEGQTPKPTDKPTDKPGVVKPVDDKVELEPMTAKPTTGTVGKKSAANKRSTASKTKKKPAAKSSALKGNDGK